MTQRSVLTKVLAEINKEQSLSGTSIIVTVFGDCVSQHSGSIWLGSLIRALAPLGINERLVRTSVFRLVNDGWLSVSKIARRSYYSFTDVGKSQFERVARRIYQAEQPEWDSGWTLLVLSSLSAEKKDELKKKLLWQGFGQLGHDLFAHHRFDNQSLDEILNESDAMNDVVILQAEAREFHSRVALKALVQEKWGIAELEGRYKRFLMIFRPVLDAIIKKSKLSHEDCFLLRILLIHEYRRILLRDHDLPVELLPSGWPGLNARNLTVSLYSRLSPKSEEFITSELESAEGPLPKASSSFYERFS